MPQAVLQLLSGASRARLRVRERQRVLHAHSRALLAANVDAARTRRALAARETFASGTD